MFVALGAPIIGSLIDLIDRIGRKHVLRVSTGLYGLAGGAGYFLDTLPTLLASRAVLGIAVAGTGAGLLVPNLNAWIAFGTGNEPFMATLFLWGTCLIVSMVLTAWQVARVSEAHQSPRYLPRTTESFQCASWF